MSALRPPPEYLRWLVLAPRVRDPINPHVDGYDVLPFVDEETARACADTLGMATPRWTVYVVETRGLT